MHQNSKTYLVKYGVSSNLLISPYCLTKLSLLKSLLEGQWRKKDLVNCLFIEIFLCNSGTVALDQH